MTRSNLAVADELDADPLAPFEFPDPSNTQIRDSYSNVNRHLGPAAQGAADREAVPRLVFRSLVGEAAKQNCESPQWSAVFGANDVGMMRSLQILFQMARNAIDGHARKLCAAELAATGQRLATVEPHSNEFVRAVQEQDAVLAKGRAKVTDDLCEALTDQIISAFSNAAARRQERADKAAILKAERARMAVEMGATLETLRGQIEEYRKLDTAINGLSVEALGAVQRLLRTLQPARA